MNIAILGFGTVGYGVYELAQKSDKLNVSYVLDLKTHDDINAKSVTDYNIILNDDTVDTVVELIGGNEPAYTYIRRALCAKKNVVTANKLVICEHYDELTALALQNNVSLRYTAAVGGGIPWLTNLERTVRIANVHRVRGIFNGTTNYILDAMHRDGTSFDAALKQAQDLGFAELDPSSDIDGLDTKRKIAISANIAFGVSVNHDEVDVIGIRNITSAAVNDSEAHGYICRLIAKARNKNGEISVWVEPTFVKSTSPYAGVTLNYNRISFDADSVGRTSFLGYGAGRYPTAFTVVNDCIDVANGAVKTYNPNRTPISINNEIVRHPYYVSTTASNSWLESIKAKLWNHGILTEPVSVAKMHETFKELLKTDPDCFVASVY